MYDLIVLGGGPGGYRAAELAAKAGMQVALVERDRLGGTCLHRGCIPTKCYFGDLAGHGNPRDMWTRRNGVVGELEGGIKTLLGNHGVHVVTGRGFITDAGDVKRVSVTPAEGEPLQLEGARLLIATGAASFMPPFEGRELDEVIPGDWAAARADLWDEATGEAVRSVVIAGAGVIAVEMAGLLRSMGKAVTLLKHPLDKKELLLRCDADLRKKLAQSFRKRGVTLVDDFVIDAVRRVDAPEGRLSVEGRSGEEPKRFAADRLIVACGMRPVTTGLGLEAAGIALVNGAIAVNNNMETNVPGVYAVGDVTGGKMLAHEAEYEALAAVSAMTGRPYRVNRDVMPACIFTDPEIAMVGMTEEEAKASGVEVAVGRAYYLANGMARALGRTDGFVKVIADAARDNLLLGAHFFGHDASNLVGEAALALSGRMTARQVAECVHAHPTLSECFKEALCRLPGM